jgi:DNA-binding NtrC family response regulator
MVDSEIDQGTSVRIYLPRTLDMPRPVGDDVISVSRSVKDTRVLVVEDDEAVRNIATRFIRGQGYDVYEAGNGKEAVELLRSEQLFDILFTDVMLPGGMTGVEVAENAAKYQPDIKVLLPPATQWIS